MQTQVNENDVGAAVIRLQHDTASMGDVAQVANILIASRSFRERCSVLGQMAGHLPERKRQENAEALCSIIFEKHAPAEEAPAFTEGRWVAVSPMFIVDSSPMQGGAWDAHFQATYAKSRAMQAAKVSPYCAEIIRSVEEMWGLSGHLLDA